MTERVYYTSDATDGRAQIIACTAEADGRYAIELDRTLFHPQGGGQPADRGWIAGQAVETVIVRGDSVLLVDYVRYSMKMPWRGNTDVYVDSATVMKLPVLRSPEQVALDKATYGAKPDTTKRG